MADGLSLRSIAKALGRATSTISRELDTRINARSSRGVRMISGAAAGLAAYPATSP
jgi:IS30 family transposase